MERRSIRRFLKDNKFFIINLLIAIVVCASVYYWDKWQNRGDFSISCYGGDFLLECKPSDRGNICPPKLRDNLAAACRNLEGQNIRPFGRTKVSVLLFKHCEGWMKKINGCFPFFYQAQDKNKKNYNYVVFTAQIFSHKEFARFLIHELAHALAGSGAAKTTRIIAEFLAIYVENVASGGNIAQGYACREEKWNQPGLATSDGDFIVSISEDVPAPFYIVNCRYGQLAHIARRLRKEYSAAFPRLWQKIGAYEKGRIGLGVFMELVKESDEKAARFFERYHVFRDADNEPHIVFVAMADNYLAMVYRIKGRGEEFYISRGNFRIAMARREKGEKIFSVWSYPIADGVAIIPKSHLESSDFIVAEVSFGKQQVIETFYLR